MDLKFQLSRFKYFCINKFRNFLDLYSYIFWVLADPSKFKKIKTSEIKSILVIYAGAVGDAYNAIGLLNKLISLYPSLKIYYLTIEKNRKFVKNPKIKILTKEESKKLIRSKKIDACVMLQGWYFKEELFDYELYKLLRKIPYRTNCDNAQINPSFLLKQIIRTPLSTRKVYSVETNGFEDHVKAFRLMGFNIDKPEFYYTAEGEKFAKDFLKKHMITSEDKLFFINPGAGKISKALREKKVPSSLWPIKRWGVLATTITKEKGNKVIFLGAKEDQVVINSIFAKLKNKKNIFNASGKTPDIESVASLLNKGDLLISVDTGTVHIAAAVGIPEIILFGSTPPKNVSPLTHKKIEMFNKKDFHGCRRYACEICYKKHMHSITLKDIEKSINYFLTRN